MFLLEYQNIKDHWKDRIQDRIKNINDIVIPDLFFNSQDDKKQIKEDLIKAVKQEVMKKVLEFQHNEIDLDRESYFGSVIGKVEIKRGDKEWAIILKTPEGDGDTYIAYSHDNVLYTLILHENPTREFIANRMIRQAANEFGVNLNPTQVKIRYINDKILIDYDNLNKPNISLKVDEESLPYIPRTDYRKGAKFFHKTYGEGEIVTTSNGSTGKGDANGKLHWVDVDFKKPYLKGGIVSTIRRIPGIVTKVALN